MIENWLVALDLANQTKNHMLYTLRIVLSEAKSEKLIPSNPLAEAEPLSRNHRSRDALTMDELHKLFPKPHLARLLEVWKTLEYASLFMTLASTGIRSGEARALAWRHVLPGGWLFVERAVKMGGSIGPTKTQDKRVIALPFHTRAILRLWHGESPFKEPEHLIFYGWRRTSFEPKDCHRLVSRSVGACRVQDNREKLGRAFASAHIQHNHAPGLPEEILRLFTGTRPQK